jgi:hypothetical protein
VPWKQAHVGQEVIPLCESAKHPIVTFLGRSERSEERSDLTGYDDRRSFRCRDARARKPQGNAEGECQKSNGGRSSRCCRRV